MAESRPRKQLATKAGRTMGQAVVSKNGKRLERGKPAVEAEQREQRGLRKKVLAGAGKGRDRGRGPGATVGSVVPDLGTVAVGAAGGVAGAALSAKAARAEAVQERHERTSVSRTRLRRPRTSRLHGGSRQQVQSRRDSAMRLWMPRQHGQGSTQPLKDRRRRAMLCCR
ncbi:hypothetical protein AHiyo8_01910 [Arthrobacter sp. Hiyo8]|nr:hypothetical protein AHiyo8_01910 [Arthrobacter sp. Hiyo8]